LSRASALFAVAFAALALSRAVGTEGSSHVPPCPKPGDPIAINDVRISEAPIRAGSTVSGTVLATCNVAAVTAQVGTYRIGVPKAAPGVFRTTVHVPRFVWPGHFALVVTAIRTDGATVSKTMPIDVRW
jgi:hypothetical protein